MKKIGLYFAFILIPMQSVLLLYGYGDYKTFSGYGLSFNYSKEYAVTTSEKEEYNYISLSSKDMRVSIQAFKSILDSPFIDNYIKQYENTLKKSQVKLERSVNDKRDVYIIDYKKSVDKKRKIPAREYTAIFSHSGIELKSTFIFFSYAKKGYILSFTYQSKLDKSKDIEIIQRSFTIE